MRFGSKVTLVEMLPQILPVEDEDVSKLLHRAFEKQGIAVHVGTKCENFRVGPDVVKLDLVKDGKSETVEAETVLSAIGVVANLDGVLSPQVKLELDRGYLKVGDDYQTQCQGHLRRGRHHRAALAGARRDLRGGQRGERHVRPRHAAPGEEFSRLHLLPAAGRQHRPDRKGGEGEGARIQGRQVSRSPPAARRWPSGESEGFVKILGDAKTGEIYGAHIIGAEATELIAEFGLAIELEATVEDLHHTIHAHPTLSEAVMEAAAATTGEAIHI